MKRSKKTRDDFCRYGHSLRDAYERTASGNLRCRICVANSFNRSHDRPVEPSPADSPRRDVPQPILLPGITLERLMAGR